MQAGHHQRHAFAQLSAAAGELIDAHRHLAPLDGLHRRMLVQGVAAQPDHGHGDQAAAGIENPTAKLPGKLPGMATQLAPPLVQLAGQRLQGLLHFFQTL